MIWSLPFDTSVHVWSRSEHVERPLKREVPWPRLLRQTQPTLTEADFDRRVEALCQPYCTDDIGLRSSIWTKIEKLLNNALELLNT